MDDSHPSNRPQWQIEATHPHLVPALTEAFNNVKDPELGFSIIQLGLVRDVSIEDGTARIIMLLTTPFCPYGPALVESTKQYAQKSLDMPVEMELSTQMWDPAMMDEDLHNDWGLF